MTVFGVREQSSILGNKDSVSISSDDENDIGHDNLGKNTDTLVYRHKYGTVELHRQSLDCLKSGSYLDDNIIQFYSAFLLNNCQESHASRFHIFDSIFFDRLNKIFGDSIDVNQWRQLNKWYSHVDIFSKDFLLFPVCSEDHWFLIVVCYPNAIKPISHGAIPPTAGQSESIQGPEDEFQDTFEDVAFLNDSNVPQSRTRHPGVIVMDSIGLKNRSITQKVRDFLDFEWRSKCSTIKRFAHQDLPDYFPNLPKQKNAFDCGMFMVVYMKQLLNDPERFYHLVRKNDSDARHELKHSIRSLIGENDRKDLKRLIISVCNSDT